MTNKTKKALGVLTLAALGTGVTSDAAFAADAPQPSAEAAAVGEILVTAQKRSERLIDVPISISAESFETMKAAGVGDLRELSQLVTGLSQNMYGIQMTPTIRGISTQSVTVGDETNIALYLDDVYLANSFANLLELKDIERIEVLKGPQGTLAGRNATGGAIKVFTRDPTASPSAEMTARYGFDLNERQITALVSGGPSDALAASVSGYYDKADGYVTNVNPAWTEGKIGGVETYTVRGKLVAKPTDALRIALTADQSRTVSSADYASSTLNNNNAFRSRAGVFVSTGGRTISASFVVPAIAKSRGLSMNANWDFGPAYLKSITAYRDVDGRYSSDTDRTNLPIGSNVTPFKSTSVSQEFNFGGATERLSWVTGVYYLNYRAAAVNTNFVSNPFVLPPSTLIPNGQNLKNYSAFADATYEMTDKWSVTGGIRYSRDERDARYLDLLARTGAGNRDFAQSTYRAVTKYDLTDRSNVYASYSTGYKSGLFSPSTLPLEAVQPEKISAWEVGYKAQFESGLFLTLAAYDYKYRDIQLVVSRPVPGSATATSILLQNAARAHTRGIDADARWQIGEVQLRGGVAWLPTAEYVSFPAAFVYAPLPAGGNVARVIDESGKRLIKAPKLQANLGAAYAHELDVGRLTASVNYSYNSGFSWVVGDRLRQKAYSLVNARLGWEINDHVELGLWAENLTDSLYARYTAETSSGDSSVFARPRQIGVSVGLKY